MAEEQSTKLIIQFVVYPLVTTVVTLVLVIFNSNVSNLKEKIKKLETKQEKDLDQFLAMMEKFFKEIENTNKDVNTLFGRIRVAEERCKLKHK